MDVLGKDRRDAFGLKSGSQVGHLLFSLVALILLLSSLYAAEASVFKKARETALDAASPILKAFSGPIRWVNERVGDISDYFLVLEQNKALREENAALRQWEEEARSLRAVVAALEDLDVYKAPPEARPINAFVIGEANEAYAHSMIVNAGAADGVAAGLAAVDERGMIGRIVDVSKNASRILLLNDIQSRIPVFVEGSYVEGLLVGRSTTKPTIAVTMLADGDKVAAGQRVITSGAGGVLPRGLAVGVVEKVNKKEAVIDLAADYARTRMVRIINYDFPQVDPEAAETPPPPLEETPTAAPAARAANPPAPERDRTTAEAALVAAQPARATPDPEPASEPAPATTDPAEPIATTIEPAELPAIPVEEGD